MPENRENALPMPTGQAGHLNGSPAGNVDPVEGKPVSGGQEAPFHLWAMKRRAIEDLGSADFVNSQIERLDRFE